MHSETPVYLCILKGMYEGGNYPVYDFVICEKGLYREAGNFFMKHEKMLCHNSSSDRCLYSFYIFARYPEETPILEIEKPFTL